MNNKILKEVCVGSFSEAKRAFLNKADRIELCDNLHEGGTTPSYGTIKHALELTKNICVMIRPRGGDFEYSNEEFSIMKEDIRKCKELGVPIIVFGLLQSKQIDFPRMKQLVELAKPMQCVFHMAFDEIENYELAFQQLIELKIQRVLTKGGNVKNALEGKENIKNWIDRYGQQIEILPGGGITYQNYEELVIFTGATQVHGTKIIKFEQFSS